MPDMRVYIEPRDAWIGAYIAKDAVYVCPLPFLVFRWQRRVPSAVEVALKRDPASTTNGRTDLGPRPRVRAPELPPPASWPCGFGRPHDPA